MWPLSISLAIRRCAVRLAYARVAAQQFSQRQSAFGSLIVSSRSVVADIVFVGAFSYIWRHFGAVN